MRWFNRLVDARTHVHHKVLREPALPGDTSLGKSHPRPNAPIDSERLSSTVGSMLGIPRAVNLNCDHPTWSRQCSMLSACLRAPEGSPPYGRMIVSSCERALNETG